MSKGSISLATESSKSKSKNYTSIVSAQVLSNEKEPSSRGKHHSANEIIIEEIRGQLKSDKNKKQRLQQTQSIQNNEFASKKATAATKQQQQQNQHSIAPSTIENPPTSAQQVPTTHQNQWTFPTILGGLGASPALGGGQHQQMPAECAQTHH